MPIDDAKLLVDAAASTSPYKAPTLRDGRNNEDAGGAYADLLRIYDGNAACTTSRRALVLAGRHPGQAKPVVREEAEAHVLPG